MGLTGFVIAVFVSDFNKALWWLIGAIMAIAISNAVVIHGTVAALPYELQGAFVIGVVGFLFGRLISRALDRLEVWFQRRIVAQKTKVR